MKKLVFCVVALLGLSVVPTWAVGTCTVNNNGTAVVIVACTGDASTGSFPATPITGLIYPLSQVEIVPGTTAPTAGWSVTLTDFNGSDQLSGQATNLGASGSQAYGVSATRIPTVPTLTLNITGNSVASATVTIWLYLNATLAPTRSITEKGTRWAINNTPASGSQATVSRAAAAGVRHVADCVTISLSASAAPASASAVSVNLRDGATGAGTVLWTQALTSNTAIGNFATTAICGLAIIGSPNTAMTLEFSGAATTTQEAVSLSGYDVE